MNDRVVKIERTSVTTDRCNARDHRLPEYDVLLDGDRVGSVRKVVWSEQRWTRHGTSNPVHPTKTVFGWKVEDDLYGETHPTRSEAVEAVLRRV